MDGQEFIRWLYGPEGGSSAERAQHVLRWAQSLSSDSGAEFWTVLVDAWSSLDLIPHDDFSAQFLRFSGSAPDYNLDENVQLYRGQDWSAPLGLSWTTCLDTAARFAQGHRGIQNPNPMIFSLMVFPKKVAFKCDDRGEQEHVLFSVPSHRECLVVRS
jgi:hypothetical protein